MLLRSCEHIIYTGTPCDNIFDQINTAINAFNAANFKKMCWCFAHERYCADSRGCANDWCTVRRVRRSETEKFSATEEEDAPRRRVVKRRRIWRGANKLRLQGRVFGTTSFYATKVVWSWTIRRKFRYHFLWCRQPPVFDVHEERKRGKRFASLNWSGRLQPRDKKRRNPSSRAPVLSKSPRVLSLKEF